MKMKSGISLIVLVITIIIIIILAGAVILNLADNNPIENASEAQILSDLDTFNSDLTLQIGNKYLGPNGTMLKTEDMDSKAEKDWELVDLVPSIKGTDYEEHLTVENGKLKLRADSDLDDTTKAIIESKLGKAVLSKEMIFENEESIKKYIGMKVEYSGYSGYTETTNIIEWRLFGLDNEGNLMLKANDYVSFEYKKSTYPEGIELGNNNYNITSNKDRTTLINYIGSSGNWNEYAISGKTQARGTMTFPEFVNGYNLVNSEKLEVKYFNKGFVTNDSKILKDNGYLIKKLTEDESTYSDYIPKINQKYQDMNYYISDKSKAHACWLANQNPKSNIYVYGLGFNGDISYIGHDCINFGIFPVVSLTSSSIIINADGNLVVE